ncbi:hypothetical protein BJ165DRAFT_1406678 [Panaeolus papilionaceus]|nr:hypothetical protein BJ165DRAFT_1406678 [Panaeolus papilionaceus]
MPVDESSDEDDDDDEEDEDEAAMAAHDAADYVEDNDRGEEEDDFAMYVEEESELDVMSSQMEDKLDINHIPANGSSKTTGGHIRGRALGNSAKMADLAHMDIHQEPEPLMGLVQVYLASESTTVNPNSNPPLTSFVIPSMSSLAAVLEAILQNHLPALKGRNPLVHVWTSFGQEGAPFWLSYGILNNIDSPKYHGQSWFVDQSSSTYMLYVLFQTTLLSTPASSAPVSASSQLSSHPSFSVAAASSSSRSASPHTTTIAKSGGSISDDAIITFLNLDPDLAQKPPTRSPIKATYQHWAHFMEKRKELAELKTTHPNSLAAKITNSLLFGLFCSTGSQATWKTFDHVHLFPNLQEWFTNPSPDPSLTTAVWKGWKPDFSTLKKFYVEQGLMREDSTGGSSIIQGKLTSLMESKDRRYKEYEAALELEAEKERREEREKRKEEKKKRKVKEKVKDKERGKKREEKGNKEDNSSTNNFLMKSLLATISQILLLVAYMLALLSKSPSLVTLLAALYSIPLVIAAPTQEFPAITFAAFNQVILENFHADIKLDTVLILLFSILENPEVFNHHSRQKYKKVGAEHLASFNGWISAFSNTLLHQLPNHEKDVFGPDASSGETGTRMIDCIDNVASAVGFQSYSVKGKKLRTLKPINFQSLQPIHIIAPISFECETHTSSRDLPQVKLLKDGKVIKYAYVIQGKCSHCNTIYAAD